MERERRWSGVKSRLEDGGGEIAATVGTRAKEHVKLFNVSLIIPYTEPRRETDDGSLSEPGIEQSYKWTNRSRKVKKLILFQFLFRSKRYFSVR